MRVISLGLRSVNRVCSTDGDTAKCVKVVYRSVHICTSRLVNKDFLSAIVGKLVTDVDELKGQMQQKRLRGC